MQTKHYSMNPIAITHQTAIIIHLITNQYDKKLVILFNNNIHITNHHSHNSHIKGWKIRYFTGTLSPHISPHHHGHQVACPVCSMDTVVLRCQIPLPCPKHCHLDSMLHVEFSIYTATWLERHKKQIRR